MTIHNPKDYVLCVSKESKVWEIPSKATVTFTREESQNMFVPDDIIIIERDILYEDIVQ